MTTEVTRIACPGCRSLLRFEPEALDFPADCGGCDCRFSVGIYVKIACPSCQAGSKIREKYLSQRVRCVRCSHPFIATEGVPHGGGGRLLVARMLDTDATNPPETIQPFLGHAREEYDRRFAAASQVAAAPAPVAVGPTPQAREAERQKTEAIAERERLVQEAGLYKAILAKLVTSSANDPEADSADASLFESLATLGTSMAPGLPGAAKAQSEVALWRANEEKSRLEGKLKKLQAELAAATAEVAKNREAVNDRAALLDRVNAERELGRQHLLGLQAERDAAVAELASHRALADDHSTQHDQERENLKQRLHALEAERDAALADLAQHQELVHDRSALADQATQERELVKQQLGPLQAELEKVRLEAAEHRTRLETEVPTAREAAERANQRVAEAEARLDELTRSLEAAVAKEAALIADHARALEEADRQRTALSITNDRLSQAVISARSGEYEALDRLEEYASGLAEADATRQAELTAERQRSHDLELVVKELQSDIESIRLENLANSKVKDAEANEIRRRFAEERKTLTAELDKSRAEAAEAVARVTDVLSQSQTKLDASGTLAEEWRIAAEDAQAQLQAEVARLEASLAKREQIRSSLADENKRLTETIDKLNAENRRLVAQAAEAAASAGDSSSQGPPNKRLAQAIEQNEMLHLDNVRLGNLVESAKVEADRRQKSLVLEIQRIKSEYEKLVSANERLVDRVQELLADKMAAAEAAQASNGVRSVGPAPVPSAIDADEAELLANRSKEVELHRDIAFSVLYGDTLVDKRPGKNGH